MPERECGERCEADEVTWAANTSARVTMQVSGQTYLNTFALDPRNVHRDILALAAMFALLAGACWLRLHVRFAMQRRRGRCFGG